MPLTHLTPVFSVDEAAIYKVTADAAGGSLTFGAKIAIPGIIDFEVNPEILYKEAFGDNKVIATASKLRSIKGKASCTHMSLDVIQALLSGTITDAGTTPNMTATLDVKGNDIPGYVKFEGRMLGVELPSAAGGGSLNFTIWKSKISNFTFNPKGEEFATLAFDFTGVPTAFDNKILTIKAYETAAALSA